VFAFRSPARALAAGLPRQDHVYKTTNELFRLHNKNFDEIRCKLDSIENPRSFEKHPTPPQKPDVGDATRTAEQKQKELIIKIAKH